MTGTGRKNQHNPTLNDIPRIPEDLYDLTVSHFFPSTHPTDRRTLVSLQRVNRSFFIPATRRLYQDLHVRHVHGLGVLLKTVQHGVFLEEQERKGEKEDRRKHGIGSELKSANVEMRSAARRDGNMDMAMDDFEPPPKSLMSDSAAAARNRLRFYRSSARSITFEVIPPLFVIPTSLLEEPSPHAWHTRTKHETQAWGSSIQNDQDEQWRHHYRSAVPVLFPNARSISFTPQAPGYRPFQPACTFSSANGDSFQRLCAAPAQGSASPAYTLPSTLQGSETYANFFARLLSPNALIIHRPSLDAVRNQHRYHEKHDKFFRALCDHWAESLGQIEIYGEIRRLSPFSNATSTSTPTRAGVVYELRPCLRMLGVPTQHLSDWPVHQVTQRQFLKLELEMLCNERYLMIIRTLAEAIVGFIKPHPLLHSPQAHPHTGEFRVLVQLPCFKPPGSLEQNGDLQGDRTGTNDFRLNAANLEEMIVDLIQLRMPLLAPQLIEEVIERDRQKKKLVNIHFASADNHTQHL
ncbi:hypothetical protein I317_00686 [Kwoniella heveanensis CBS 569]|nr:hypothetical protein I317_00686 [Kwoniella heveanensis CBS 569]